MFAQEKNLEEKIQKNERKINELSIKMDAVDREVHALLNELNVTPDQLTQFVHTEKNFAEEDWAKLQEEQQKMHTKLQVELQSIRNPKEMQKRYAERVVQNHWLFVR